MLQVACEQVSKNRHRLLKEDVKHRPWFPENGDFNPGNEEKAGGHFQKINSQRRSQSADSCVLHLKSQNCSVPLN